MNRINAEFRRDTQKSPYELEREIDATRAELQATLEELEHRLSPSDLLGQLWGQVRRHGGEFGENLGHSLKENPVPALLTSIGIAWMMASNGRRHDGNGAGRRLREGGERMSEAGERMRESGGRLRERIRGARDAMRGRRETAREGLMSARERMASSAHSMGERARSMSAGARRRAGRAGTGFGHLLEEQPLLLGAIGLAAGAIAGAALPSTEHEDRAFGAARDRALERMKRAGSEGARRVRERAEEAAEKAKSAMEEQRHAGETRGPEPGREQPISSEAGSSTSSPGTGLGY